MLPGARYGMINKLLELPAMANREPSIAF